MRIAYYMCICFLLASCNTDEKRTYSDYNFYLDSWETDPYHFSANIKDSIIAEKGPQMAAWDYSYIGDIASMHKNWDNGASPSSTITQTQIDSFSQYKPTPAIDYITQKAKEYNVTIINEAHHMPQHRVFTTQLLQAMYDNGYRHIGLESYASNTVNDSIMNANGYPSLSNGYYVKEPQFGNILREAMRIGFEIFGYESAGHGNAKEREMGQARNIQTYINDNPNSKYLIHCGFAHAAEGEYAPSWGRTMAARLTEYTGIDPLTINQTRYSERSKREFENPYYQLTDVQEASVYVNEANDAWSFRKDKFWMDIGVFHPRTIKSIRPDWMLTGNRTIATIDISDAEIECPCLVFAYVHGEQIGSAVPYDIQETTGKRVSLVLDRGEYDIIVWNQKNKALKFNYKNEE